MTPAERDEVRRIAAGVFACDPHEANTIGGLIKLCNAVLRYVPPGYAESPLPLRVDHDGHGMVAIAFDASVVATEPNVARRLAHAIHAAADAAEGTDR